MTSDGARRLVAAAAGRGLTLAVAESLTAGMVCARVADVPGASAVLRGGVVAYASDLKVLLLDVDPDLLARHGAVHPAVAEQMAVGVRLRLRADLGLATTGVAGPDPSEGHAPGTVHVAVADSGGVAVRSLRLPGDRASVRSATTDHVLALVLERLEPA